MRIDSWDADFQALAAGLGRLEAAYNAEQREERRILTSKRLAILRYQIVIEQLVEKLQGFTRRAWSHKPVHDALIHGGALVAEQTLACYLRRATYLCRSQWLGLVRARLAGDNRHLGLMIEDKDLILMAERQTVLKKTERLLTERLMRLRKDRERLEAEYGRAQLRKGHVAAAARSARILGVHAAKARASNVAEKKFQPS